MKHEFTGKIRRMKINDSVRVFFFVVAVSVIVFAPVTGLPSQSGLIRPAYAAKFTLLVEEDVYTPGETMVIYGAGAANDVLVVRLFDPTGHALSISNIVTDSDGFFREAIKTWDKPSPALPLGTYTIEVISSLQRTDMRRIEVTFAEATQVDKGIRIPTTHNLAIKLDSPDQASVNVPFRFFIQITFDGALVAVDEADIPDLLGTSHIHFGNKTLSLEGKLKRLHEGLYFADVTFENEGPYIIHAAAFYRGLLSHDSKVITATSSSISTIQQSVTELDARLNSTNRQLEDLNQGIGQTRQSLNDTQSAITGSVDEARGTIRKEIEDMRLATGQINSLILPVLALISVIIALQISLFARIRASFR